MSNMKRIPQKETRTPKVNHCDVTDSVQHVDRKAYSGRSLRIYYCPQPLGRLEDKTNRELGVGLKDVVIKHISGSPRLISVTSE